LLNIITLDYYYAKPNEKLHISHRVLQFFIYVVAQVTDLAYDDIKILVTLVRSGVGVVCHTMHIIKHILIHKLTIFKQKLGLCKTFKLVINSSMLKHIINMIKTELGSTKKKNVIKKSY